MFRRSQYKLVANQIVAGIVFGQGNFIPDERTWSKEVKGRTVTDPETGQMIPLVYTERDFHQVPQVGKVPSIKYYADQGAAYLATHGENVSINTAYRDAQGNNILHLVIRAPLTFDGEEYEKAKSKLILRFIRSCPQLASQTNIDGDTPLHLLLKYRTFSPTYNAEYMYGSFSSSDDPSFATDDRCLFIDDVFKELRYPMEFNFAASNNAGETYAELLNKAIEDVAKYHRSVLHIKFDYRGLQNFLNEELIQEYAAANNHR